MSFCHDLVELIARLSFEIISFAACVAIGETIAAHQHEIMQRSRQAQAFLHLPTCTHIFSEGDTQINHHDIRASAFALTFTILFAIASVLNVLIEGPAPALGRPMVTCGIVTLIVVPQLLLWLHLALRCRRRQRNRRAVAWDIEDASVDDSEIMRSVESNENTALLPAEKGPEAGKQDKVDDGQFRQEGPAKKEVDTADKRSHRDGRRNSHTLRVSWTDFESSILFAL